MRTYMYPVILLLLAGALYFVVLAEDEADVVLYCGVDQDQSQQVADAFETETGLTVRYEGEIESQRSIGLPQKLLREQASPKADVFWSNEIMNMVDLSRKGVLDTLPEGVTDAFPAAWRDPEGRYVAFGARARVLLVNTELLEDRADWPDEVADLLDPKYGAMGLYTCMARPLTGTTYTHAVAMLTADETAAKAFLGAVAAAGEGGQVKLAPSNGSAMSLVSDSSNRVAFCLTDTDDAWKAIRAGAPVEVVYPDQADGAVGAVLIPNTVALVKGRPHAGEAADRMLRWLVSAANEIRLAQGPSAQIPLRSDLGGAELPEHVRRPEVDFRAATVPWGEVGANRDRWLDYLTATFRAAN